MIESESIAICSLPMYHVWCTVRQMPERNRRSIASVRMAKDSMVAYPTKRTWPHVLVVVTLFVASLQFPSALVPESWRIEELASCGRAIWTKFEQEIARWQRAHRAVTPDQETAVLSVSESRMLLTSLVLKKPGARKVDPARQVTRSESSDQDALPPSQVLHPPVASRSTARPTLQTTSEDSTDDSEPLVAWHDEPTSGLGPFQSYPSHEATNEAGHSDVPAAPDGRRQLAGESQSDKMGPSPSNPSPPRYTPPHLKAPAPPATESPSSSVEVAGTAESIRGRGETNEVAPPISVESSLGIDLPATDQQNLSDWLPKQQPAPKAGKNDLVLNQAWPFPTSLHELLKSFPPESMQVASWKAQVNDQLSVLQSQRQLDDEQSKVALRELQQLVSDAPSLEIYLTGNNRINLRRVRFAVERRVAIWWHIRSLAAAQKATPHIVEPVSSYGLLQDVSRHLATQSNADGWSDYLLLDQLKKVSTQTWGTDAAVRRRVARQVLQRLDASELNGAQQQFLAAPVFGRLETEMLKWADGDVDLVKLANVIEQYEDVKSAALAGEVVELMDSVRYSRRGGAQPLYDALNLHYRNANVRISVTGKLMNDLLPVLKPIQQQIRDHILGAEVVGQNQTQANLQVRLVPDEGRIRLRLLANGVSQSQTVSSRGPVRFLSRDRSNFVADKDLIVGTNGVFVTRARATSHNRSTLVDVESDYDEVPLLGWVIRHLARDEHAENRPLLRAQVNQRVRRRASRQLDESVHQRLTGAEERIDTSVLEPLRNLAIDPQTVEMRTTKERATVRFRLASHRQLAAYTPRPRALKDSAMSLQLHESAANNVLHQLKLEDRRFELEALLQELASQLGIERTDIDDQLPEGVEVRLGNERPIQFEFDDGRVLVSIHLQELKVPRRKTYRNFIVRARYLPAIDGTNVNLEREGGIELISDQIRFRDQIALRGIFTKVMTRNHKLNVLRGRIQNNAQLNDLAITQFEARDGWIGISLGKQRRDRVADVGQASDGPTSPRHR